ncbi:MAG: M1 family metallopeptidase [Cyclobacteriaceae bacterium]
MNFELSQIKAASGVVCLALLLSCQSTQLPVQTPAAPTASADTAAPAAPEVIVSAAVPTTPYKATRTRENDLIHTKLEVSFDWQKQHLIGKATLELAPYFFPQSQLILDAKGFDIHQINLIEGSQRKKLDYNYDELHLTIDLGKTYPKGEHYFVEIDYTAKPNEREVAGGVAITSDKGLYFINADSSDPDKPRQIWTQGQPDANSAWFPTIDSPNERTTQEIYITVLENFKTLSNGQLVFSRANGDGTRTDYWKMEKSHPPYLFMMAIGEYAVVKDDWQGMEVSYYVEPKYEPYAKAIFGNTPEMLSFFSKKLNYKYPWNKYAQVVVRDYVSGAMENTTASVFMEQLQVDDRALLDEDWDGIIAHELFHQWFGDLVTCESWANLPLNEGFANYSEYLWAEHKHGREEADYFGRTELQGYLAEAQDKQVDLIRFHYEKNDDLFDAHSYNKAGRIIHMLRGHVGDEAFFKSLEHYLKTNQYQPVEVHNLRLAFEQVTGEDLNWFFNQWFLDAGHPQMLIEQKYSGDSLHLIVRQMQDLATNRLFRVPMEVAIWTDGKKQQQTIIVDQANEKFSWPQTGKPDLVSIDPQKLLVAEISFEQTKSELAYQYEHSPYVLSRLEALEKMLEDSIADELLVTVLTKALDDSFWGIRQLAAQAFAGYGGEYQTSLEEKLVSMSTGDKKSLVREATITTLSTLNTANEFKDIYRSGLADRSYAVNGASLLAYLSSDATDKEELIAKYTDEENIHLVLPVAEYYVQNSVVDKYDWFQNKVTALDGEQLFYFIGYFAEYLLLTEPGDMTSGAKELEELARNHPIFYIRFASYRAMGLLEDMEGISATRQDIKRNETDPRLKAAYDSIP